MPTSTITLGPAVGRPTPQQPASTYRSAAQAHRDARASHWDRIAQKMDSWTGLGGYYHSRLRGVYQFLIPPNSRVLELGCAAGDLLASLEPSVGVGIDISKEMISRGKERHPHLKLIHSDAHEIDLDEKFDFIILSDLIVDLWDVQTVLENIAKLSTPRTRVIINSYSRLWEKPLTLAKRLRLSRPMHRKNQNWLTVEDIGNLLCLSGFEMMRNWSEVIWPIRTPIINPIFNKFLVRLWPFKHLALSNFLLARPTPRRVEREREPVVSVIVPARNEAGNITQIMQRTPEMGGGTELVFVEGHSSDGTYEAIEQTIAQHSDKRCQLLRQTGKGKGDAVRLGYTHATGDILMILDADLTVPPEDLPRFYEAIRSGKGEFINGVRLVYPMEGEAMRFFNLLGNKFFGLAFSWLLGQPIKDSLCGTKVLWKRDYDRLAATRAYFGHFDPFGDFDLLFGAAKLNLKILDMPIRYRKRTYGSTQIQRWRHGALLMRMVMFAASRIKFV